MVRLGSHRAMHVTLVAQWKQFSCPISTPVSSSLNGDAFNLIYHTDLDCALVQTHTFELSKATEAYFLLTLHAHLRSAGWGLCFTPHLLQDPSRPSSHYLEYCQSPYQRRKSSQRSSPASALT